MADYSSYIFDLTRVNRFMRDINRNGCFLTDDMNGTDLNYRFVLATSTPSKNIGDCLDDDGSLNDNVILYSPTDPSDGLCSLLYSDGIGGDASISIASNSVSFDIGDDEIFIEGLFLIDANTGYVVAYCILNSLISVTNVVVLPTSGVLWSIRNEL